MRTTPKTIARPGKGRELAGGSWPSAGPNKTVCNCYNRPRLSRPFTQGQLILKSENLERTVKSICTLLLALLLFVSISMAQNARTDVYHVHFAKAALGKAAEEADFLKTPDSKAPMPGHILVLRHQDGEDWDYAVIEHLGTKATVDAAGTAVPAAMRDLNAWHTDTFVNGPPWPEFAKAMGIDEGSTAKTGGSVYVVSVYRAAPGHRDQLEKSLGQAAPGTSGSVLMQHLEGGPWQYRSEEH